MTDLPNVKLKVLPQFPAAVLDGTGIDVTSSNGTYRFDLDFGDFAPPVAITDFTNQTALFWNSSTRQYTLGTFQAIVPTWTGVHTFNAQVTTEGQVVSPLQTLAVAATLGPWDASLGQKAKVTLNQAGHTMPALTNAVEGTSYYLWVIQDGTGSRTITTWTSAGAGSFDFGTTGVPTLTTTANRADLITFEAISIAGTLKLRFSNIQKGFS
jgi:hypothetical protein